MSSSRRMSRSSPSSLNSLPEYLPNRILSPGFTSIGISLPLSSYFPLPTATILPSCGFSLAVSGIIIPPLVRSSSLTRLTRIRSPNGLNPFMTNQQPPYGLLKVLLTGRFPRSEVNYCPGFVNWHSQCLSANGILAMFPRIASPVDKVVDEEPFLVASPAREDRLFFSVPFPLWEGVRG